MQELIVDPANDHATLSSPIPTNSTSNPNQIASSDGFSASSSSVFEALPVVLSGASLNSSWLTSFTSHSSFAIIGNSLYMISGSRLLQYTISEEGVAPIFVAVHDGVVLRAGGSISLSLIPAASGNSRLLIVTDDSFLQVVSAEGKVVFENELQNAGTAILGHAWLEHYSELKAESNGPAIGGGNQLLLAVRCIDGVNKLLFLQDAKVAGANFGSVNVGMLGGVVHEEEINRHISQKILVSAASPNPCKLFTVYGIDQREYCWSLTSRYKSDFPGPMYPVAFHLLKQGVTYMEAEDELDLVVNGQIVRTVAVKDPLSDLKPVGVNVDIGSSFLTITNNSNLPTTRRKKMVLHFDKGQLDTAVGNSRVVLSYPKPQVDVLNNAGARIKPAWMAQPTSKKAMIEISAEAAAGEAFWGTGRSERGADDVFGGCSEERGTTSLAQFLRPPERVLNGDLNRKLNLHMRNSDEMVRICLDEANYGAYALDHLIPNLPPMPPLPNSNAKLKQKSLKVDDDV